MDNPDRKINRETSILNDTVNQMYLKDIFRVFHPGVAQYKFFLHRPWNFLQKIS
jgi:hypothetical protein